MEKNPESCPDMASLRALIDGIDAELVSLLGLRSRCIDRAAEIKPGAGLPARIGERVEEVVANAREAAGMAGADPDLVENLWRQLIEWSIAREEVLMGRSEKTDHDS